jgi:enediyne biosynthesis protein E4
VATSDSNNHRSAPVQVAAIVLVAALGVAARVPTASNEEAASLASRFRFHRTPLPLADSPIRFDAIDVNPTITHLRRYFSSLSSSVAFGDLDEDGVSNDICHVEMRTKEVIVSPAPGTGERYRPFALDPYEGLDRSKSFPTKCLVGDFNEDGLADLLVLHGGAWPVAYLRRSPTSANYRPSAAAYAARQIARGGAHWMSAAVVTGDIDGDGHADLVVGNYFGDGSPALDTTAPAAVEMQDSFTAARNGGSNRVLLWQSASVGEEPDVVFREVPNPFPGDDAKGWTLALGLADLDRDGLVDLYVANDFGPDSLYANRSTPGQVRLTALRGRRDFWTPTSRVLGEDSFKSMGVDFADVNGDGYFDMFVSNIAAPWAGQESHFLWTSTGRVDLMDAGVAPYVDRGEEEGVAHSSWGWDSRLIDFDNDGVHEAIQATGFLKGSTNRWPNLGELTTVNDRLIRDPRIWLNVGPDADVNGHDPNPLYARGRDGRFVDVSGHLDLGGPWNTRGVAVADADADGDLDFAFGNVWEDSQYYRNDSPPATFLALHILRAASGAAPRGTSITEGHPTTPADGWPAYGAVASLGLPNGDMRVDQVDGGSGHTGARSADVHFGLGGMPAKAALPLTVTWRDERGRVRHDTFTVSPGWHTIRLASDSAR